MGGLDSLLVCNSTAVAFPEYNTYTTAAFALTGLSFGVCAGWLTVLIMLRSTPIMQISQWHLLLGYLLSFTAMNCSAIVRTENSYAPFHNASCIVWEWLAHVPLSFVLAILAVKEFRTWQLRRKTRKLQKMDMPQLYMIIYLCTSFIISSTILAAWTGTKPPYVDPCLNYQCTMHSPAGFWAIISFQALQLILLLTVAYQDFNQGTVGGEGIGIIVTTIAMIIYFAMVLTATLSNPDSHSSSNDLNESNAVEAFVNALTLFLATTVSLSSIFGPKLRYRNKSRDEIIKLFLQKRSGSKEFGSRHFSGENLDRNQHTTRTLTPPSKDHTTPYPRPNESPDSSVDANALAQV
mmetsp:Transcript_22110/g.43519  ORF Transcript_22110/g.43519 Transcript_22110/m.43519 type:complete len:350 (+) Transcript_22110:156-1205(+)